MTFSKNFMYDEKTNTLYINSDIIMCDTKGMTFKERYKAMMAHFKLSMEERINLSKYKFQILDEIAKHKDCKLSEFSNL